jgi:hypothetical protein
MRECERLKALEPKLDAVLRDGEQLLSPVPTVALAKIAFLKRKYGASAALYGSAFARRPALADERDLFLEQAHRYAAARAAARAGWGEGADAGNFDESDRAHWRKQALEWLREELAALEAQHGRESAAGDASTRTVAKALAVWKSAGLGVPYRPESLAKLPEEERPEWMAFWKRVDELQAEAE